jgi:hypothetical protein
MINSFISWIRKRAQKSLSKEIKRKNEVCFYSRLNWRIEAAELICGTAREFSKTAPLQWTIRTLDAPAETIQIEVHTGALLPSAADNKIASHEALPRWFTRFTRTVALPSQYGPTVRNIKKSKMVIHSPSLGLQILGCWLAPPGVPESTHTFGYSKKHPSIR